MSLRGGRVRHFTVLFFPVLLFLFLVLLILLRLYPISFLHLSETKGIGHQCLVCRLLLLLDCEEWVLSNLRRSVAGRVRILCGNEILVSSSNLDVQGKHS